MFFQSAPASSETVTRGILSFFLLKNSNQSVVLFTQKRVKYCRSKQFLKKSTLGGAGAACSAPIPVKKANSGSAYTYWFVEIKRSQKDSDTVL